MKTTLLVIAAFILFPSQLLAVNISEDTKECLDCHELVTPGIVADWNKSRHSRISPAIGMTKHAQEKRISALKVSDNLLETAVGCAECHTMNASAHPGSFEHNGYTVHTVVSPADCGSGGVAGMFAPPAFMSLLPGQLPIWWTLGGMTLQSDSCVGGGGDPLLVAYLEIFPFPGASACIEVRDHGGYPRWIVDCSEPGGVDQYCVLAQGSIGGAMCADGDCVQVPVEARSWSTIKSLYR